MAWATLPTYVPLTRRGPSDPGSRGLRNTLYVVACLCLVSITAAVVHIAAKQKGCADQQLTAGPAAAAAADGLTSQGQQAGPYVVESTTNVSIKDARMLVQQQATGAQPPPALPPLRAGVPRLIHHMHKSYDALTPSQKMFYERCKVMHPHWWVAQPEGLLLPVCPLGVCEGPPGGPPWSNLLHVQTPVTATPTGAAGMWHAMTAQQQHGSCCGTIPSCDAGNLTCRSPWYTAAPPPSP